MANNQQILPSAPMKQMKRTKALEIGPMFGFASDETDVLMPAPFIIRIAL